LSLLASKRNLCASVVKTTDLHVEASRVSGNGIESEMRRALGQNWVLLLLLILAAVVFWRMGCPWLQMHGFTGLCVILYALLVLVFIFARAGSSGRPRPKRP
jgi:hypothetical protein